MRTSQILSLISRGMILGLGVLLAPALLAISGPAQAATPIQFYKSSTGCSPAALCRMHIVNVPAGKRFMVESVSCRYTTGNQAAEILQAQLNIQNAANQSVADDNLVPVRLGAGGIGAFFSANHQTLFLVGAGQKLFAEFSTDVITSLFMQCKVSGQWLP